MKWLECFETCEREGGGQKEGVGGGGWVSPELAPVTMTTVSRGSFTTGILGLDPILTLQ